MTSFGRFFDTMRKSAVQCKPCVISKLPHASEQTFAKQFLVRIWLVAQRLLRTMLFAEILMIQESNAADVRQSVPFPLQCMTQHCIIDGLVVCSLLRNAKMTAALCYLAQVQCRRKWLKDLPAAISGCNIASALITNAAYCICCDTSRTRPDLGAWPWM